MPFTPYLLLFLFSSPPSCLAKHFLVETEDNTAKDDFEETAMESGSEKGSDYSLSKTQECEMCKDWKFCRWCLRCMNFQAGIGALGAEPTGVGMAKQFNNQKFPNYGGGSSRSSINGCNSRCTVYNKILQKCWNESAFRPKKSKNGKKISDVRFKNPAGRG